MALNMKLWELGNKVVQIRQMIEKGFNPNLVYIEVNERIKIEYPIRVVLEQMLELINDIRLAVQEGSEVKKKWNFAIIGTDEDLKKIQSKIEELELCYEISVSAN